MKKLIYGIMALVLLFAGLFCITYWKYMKESNVYHEKVALMVDVQITMDKEALPTLVQLELKLCGSHTVIPKGLLLDTFYNRIIIKDSIFPCTVNATYFFENDSTYDLLVDSFDCSACSGTNGYHLSADKITYTYHP